MDSRLINITALVTPVAECGDAFPQYPYLHVETIVLNDLSRRMSNGFYIGNATPPPGDTTRRIWTMVIRPATGRGAGQPANIPMVAPFYDGS